MVNPASVVVVEAVRTPIGRYAGAFADVEAHQLGATAVREAVQRAEVDAQAVDEVVMGCIGLVGPDSYNARRVALAAGLPLTTTAFNVNRLCGSGLQALLSGAMQLQVGQSDLVVAGGNENMSRLPWLLPDARAGHRLGDRTLVDGTLAVLTDPWSNAPMGVTAENVAREHDVSREDQDAWALLSQERARAAGERRAFDSQIVPVEIPGRRGAVTVITDDEHPRPDTSLETLAALRPAFILDGTVTAGNASGINDGAAALVLMREDDAIAQGLAPLARLVDWSRAALEPSVMGFAPTLAVERLLDRTGMTIEDLDVIELNEAFAAQVLAVMRATGMSDEQVNPNGGAIAFGHPVGATGAILAVKLVHDLRDRDLTRGMVTLCIGGGQALAAIFERI